MASADGEKKIPFNIYLLKKKTDDKGGLSLQEPKDFLAKPVGTSGKPKLISYDHHQLKSNSLAIADLYIRKPHSETKPEWLSFVEPFVDMPEQLKKLRNKSLSALLVVEAKNRQFAIAFGHGRYMLNPSAYETRFGLKATLNSISPDKIASLDKQTFDATPRLTREQTMRAVSIAEYGVDVEQDLLRAIAGFTKDAYKSLGDIAFGMDSFKIVARSKIAELYKLLALALDRSESNDYKTANSEGKAPFSWVDNLQEVVDKSLIEKLDAALWSRFWRNNFESMWLCIPEIVEWASVTGFSYQSQKSKTSSEIPSYLDISEFRKTFRKNAAFNTLKQRLIYMIRADGSPAQTYSAYRCIYAEITQSQLLFILNAGQWYQVKDSFLQDTNAFIARVDKMALSDLPGFAEYNHKSEADFSIAVHAAYPKEYELVDKKNIQIGGGHSKIEFCDLFRPSDKQLIHLKRGNGSSSLSHLFAQGFVSARLIMGDSKFRAEADKLFKNGWKFGSDQPVASEFNVVYGVIDGPSNKPLTLPFFSRVNFHNIYKALKGYGFEVSLLHIPEALAFLAAIAQKKSAKASSKPVKKKKS